MTLSYLHSIRLFARRFWVRAALISGLAVVAAASAPLSGVLPFNLDTKIDSEALSELLSILTNSMLAVTTFSLSIMVSAHLAADANATPRAHRLLQEDGRTQTVIATFIGAFVYGLTLTVLLTAEWIAEGEVALVYLVTVAVLAIIVLAVLRWVAHLVGLGSVEATIRRVEEQAKTSIRTYAAAPYLGGRPLTHIPAGANPVLAGRFGYVQTIDVAAIGKASGDADTVICIPVRPGDWVGPYDPIAHIKRADPHETVENACRSAIIIGDRREYTQDLALALYVLTEIAERALSPGINDPGTAIDIIGRLIRLLASIPVPEDDSPDEPHVYVRPFDYCETMENTLLPIARDGRAFVEIHDCLHRNLADLAHAPHDGADVSARRLWTRIQSYADKGLPLDEDRVRITDLSLSRRAV